MNTVAATSLNGELTSGTQTDDYTLAMVVSQAERWQDFAVLSYKEELPIGFGPNAQQTRFIQ